MDKDLLQSLAATFAIALAVGAIAFWGGNELARQGCNASTAGMKVTVDYSFFGGCRVSTPDGRMVPLDVYREFKQQTN